MLIPNNTSGIYYLTSRLWFFKIDRRLDVVLAYIFKWWLLSQTFINCLLILIICWECMEYTTELIWFFSHFKFIQINLNIYLGTILYTFSQCQVVVSNTNAVGHCYHATSASNTVVDHHRRTRDCTKTSKTSDVPTNCVLCSEDRLAFEHKNGSTIRPNTILLKELYNLVINIGIWKLRLYKDLIFLRNNRVDTNYNTL